MVLKRFTGVLLILFMLIAVHITAAAETTHIIIVENSVKDEIYKVYKIFDATYSGVVDPAENPRTDDEQDAHEPDNSHEHSAYAYTLDKSSGTKGAAWWNVITNDPNKVTITSNKDFYANGLHFTLTGADNIWSVEQVDTQKLVTVNGQEKTVAPFDAAKFSALLYERMPSSVRNSPDATGTGNGKTGDEALKMGVPNDGYYFVTTTLGSLCSLNTTEPNAIIVEKNSVPSVEKSVSSDGVDYGKEADTNIGGTVYFKVDITDGVGTDAPIILHDVMSAGLTLDRKTDSNDNTKDLTFELESDGTPVPQKEQIDVNGTLTERVNYNVRYIGNAEMSDEDCTFELVLTNAFIKSVDDGKVITVKYTATLNKDAPIFSPETEENRLYSTNTAKITYSNQTSPDTGVKVYTYDMDIVKTNMEDDVLENAKFRLIKNGTDIKFIKVNEGEYRAVTEAEDNEENADKVSTEVTTGANGKVKITGLGSGTYQLAETQAPEGYNMLTDKVTVVMGSYSDNTEEEGVITDYKQGHIYTSADKTVQFKPTLHGTLTLADTVKVENRQGKELPSTGGIGTVLMYMVGVTLVVSAIILIIINRKRKDEDEDED